MLMKIFMNIKNRSEFICGKLLSFFLVPIVIVAIFPTEMFSEKKVTKVAVGANHTLILKEDINNGDLPDPEEEREREAEKAAQAAAPTPVTVVPPDEEKPEKKEEQWIPSNEDELLEELTRYMAKANEQD